MSSLLAACGGFLLAVLWFDLMFDVQVLRQPRDSTLPDETLASIAGYYRRVTIEARPMNRAVSGAMLIAVAGSLWQLFFGSASVWHALLALAAVVAPVVLAGVRVVPAAMRLGRQQDSIEKQSELAHAICRDHLLCLASIAVFTALQLCS